MKNIEEIIEMISEYETKFDGELINNYSHPMEFEDTLKEELLYNYATSDLIKYYKDILQELNSSEVEQKEDLNKIVEMLKGDFIN